MSRYWSERVHQLVPYVPGEQPRISNLVKLNTNENPFGPSPRAIAAMQAELGDALRLYPDPNAEQLKAELARYYGIGADTVFVGNGSDEVLAHVFLGLLKHTQPILFPDITYSFYPVYCGLYEVPFRAVPLQPDFSLNLADYAGPNGGIIFPNPNAPTGRAVPREAIRALLERQRDSVVVVDEAYIDFGGETAVPLTRDYPNLLVVQTASKSRSLAGLRVGWAIGHPDLIEALERIKNSFNSYPLGRMAIAGAAAAIADVEYFRETTNAVIAAREALAEGLVQLGFEVLPSAANFLFVTHPGRDAAQLAAQLRERAVIVRHFRQPRIEQYLRITVGTPAQHEALLSALQAILLA